MADREPTVDDKPPPPPRDVPRWVRSPVGRGLGIAGVIVALAAVAVVVTTGSVTAPFRDRALDRRGVTVEANAVDRRHVATTSGNVRIDAVKLQFSDGVGRTHTAFIDETEHQGDAVGTDAKLLIEYDPEDPSVARWKGQRLARHGFALLQMGAFAELVAFFMMIVGAVAELRTRRLYRRGEVRPGRIDRVEPFTENRKRAFRLDYSYRTDDGRAHAIWTARGVEEPSVGPAWVVVDPTSPDRSVPVLRG